MAKRLSLQCCLPTAMQEAGCFPRDDATGIAEAISGIVASADRFARLVSAPERRAQETAAMFGQIQAVDHELRDLDLGRWVGCALQDLDAADAELWRRDPAWRGHGGESIAELCRRVGIWLDGDHHNGQIVAITHGAVIRAAVLHVLKAPPASFWHLDVEPLAIADLRWTGRAWRLRALGR